MRHRSTRARKDTPLDKRIIAAGEQVFSIAASAPKPYKRAEEILQSLTAAIGQQKNPRRSNAVFLFIPFRTATRVGGEHLRGALFALVWSPEMNRDRLEGLALREHAMLHRAPFGAVESAASTAASPSLQQSTVVRRTPIRITQVIEHDKLWTALDAVFHEAEGTRVARIAAQFPEAFTLFKRYPKLEKLKDDIERASKLTDIVESTWKAMANLDRSGLYKWRKKAGLPSRR